MPEMFSYDENGRMTDRDMHPDDPDHDAFCSRTAVKRALKRGMSLESAMRLYGHRLSVEDRKTLEKAGRYTSVRR